MHLLSTSQYRTALHSTGQCSSVQTNEKRRTYTFTVGGFGVFLMCGNKVNELYIKNKLLCDSLHINLHLICVLVCFFLFFPCFFPFSMCLFSLSLSPCHCPLSFARFRSLFNCVPWSLLLLYVFVSLSLPFSLLVCSYFLFV